MSEGTPEPIERYGSVAAWSAELGIPLWALKQELGIGTGECGSTQVRQAVSNILERKKTEKEEKIAKIRTTVQTPHHIFTLAQSSGNSRLKLKDLDIKNRKEFTEYFGLCANPWDSYQGRLHLAFIIFGKDHPDVAIRIHEELELEKKPNAPAGPVVARWQEALKRKYSTAKKWLQSGGVSTQASYSSYQKAEDESGVSNADNALDLLCRRFGYNVHEISSDSELRCTIGAMIFGKDDPDIIQAQQAINARKQAMQKLREDIAKDPNIVKTQILEKYPAPVEWYATRDTAARFRGSIILPEITLKDLCEQLGMQIPPFEGMGMPNKEQEDAVAVWLYGQAAVEQYKRQREQEVQQIKKKQSMDEQQVMLTSERTKLLASIRKVTPHAGRWVNMQWKQRQTFRIKNMDLDTIALEFDIPVPPSASMRHHLLLGQEIFGKDDPTIIAALRELDETGRVLHKKMPLSEPELMRDNVHPESAPGNSNEVLL